MITDSFPMRMKSIETAKGFIQIWKLLEMFLKVHNISQYQIDMMKHALNSMYFTGVECNPDSKRMAELLIGKIDAIKKYYEAILNDNDTTQNQEATKAS